MITATREAVRTVAEWQTIELYDLALSAQDRELIDSLKADKKVRIEELRDAVRVQTFSWIGVVRFSRFELRITPKLAGEYAGLLEMLDYVSGVDALHRLKTPPADLLEGESNLFDLLAMLLCEQVERIVRKGLLADYVEREDHLPFVRGRLLADLQVLRRFGRIDRLECRFDEHLTDTPENQILGAALRECVRRATDPHVLHRVRRLDALFQDACSLDGISLPAIRTSLVYHRLNTAYRDAHVLAWVILDGLGVESIYETGRISSFAFLVDMNLLFEQFVSKWLIEVLKGSGLRVSVQRRDRSVLWEMTRNCSYAAVIPDVLIEDRLSGMRLPVDAKYKAYDSRGLQNADVYQTFLYAFAYGSGVAGVPRGLIFYPASDKAGADTHLQVRQSGTKAVGEISALRVSIPSSISELRSRQFSSRTLDLREHILRSIAASPTDFGSQQQPTTPNLTRPDQSLQT